MSKKLLTSITVILCLSASAQLIDKNDIVLHAGVGIGIFHHQFTDLQTNITDDRDTSGSVQYMFQAEYGVTRWLSGGLSFNYQDFLTDSSNSNDKATILDFGLGANLHIPWNLERFDLTGNIGYGYSRFKYTDSDVNNWQALANGSVFFWGVNPRLYFSKNQHLGIELWYRHTSHIFKNGEISDNNGFSYNFRLDGPGNSFGLGFFYKI